jgi:Icc-related predicted phosphoesterase
MKIAAISDIHGTLPDIPPCDLLLIAGDICPIRNHGEQYQANWLDTEFRRWLESLVQVRQVVGIAGNHDFVFQNEPGLVPRDLRWIYLQDELTVFEGLKIWGTPWQPWFHDWAFNGSPELLQQKWALMPDKLDVIVVHGPPRGYGDAVPRAGSVEHTGCPHLLKRIEAIKPRLVVYGHIHEGRGEWRLGDTILANVTILDVRYRHAFAPWAQEFG